MRRRLAPDLPYCFATRHWRLAPSLKSPSGPLFVPLFPTPAGYPAQLNSGSRGHSHASTSSTARGATHTSMASPAVLAACLLVLCCTVLRPAVALKSTLVLVSCCCARPPARQPPCPFSGPPCVPARAWPGHPARAALLARPRGWCAACSCTMHCAGRARSAHHQPARMPTCTFEPVVHAPASSPMPPVRRPAT